MDGENKSSEQEKSDAFCQHRFFNNNLYTIS